MVRAGLARVRDLSPQELALLPETERERRFGSERRRCEYRCGRVLLRLMLQEWTGVPAAAHRLQTTRKGKPWREGGLSLSISHSGGRVACAVTDRGEIGVDLEAPRAQRDLRRIARYVFSDEERAWYESRPDDHFYWLWVLKEAYVKALGESIFGGSNCLRCTLQPPDIRVLPDSGPLADLVLFAAGASYLAIVTTSASLRDLRLDNWLPGARSPEPDTDFRLIATRHGDET